MDCIQGVFNISLSPSWSLYSSPINVAGALLLDPNSMLIISLPANPYSGIAPITVGSSLSLQGYGLHLYPRRLYPNTCRGCEVITTYNEVFYREVIIDISSTVVDESKEIVLFEFGSHSSNTTLRMTCMNQTKTSFSRDFSTFPPPPPPPPDSSS